MYVVPIVYISRKILVETMKNGLKRLFRGGLLYAKVEKFSSSRVQIKDSGLTYGVDDETSPFLAVKVSFRVH